MSIVSNFDDYKHSYKNSLENSDSFWDKVAKRISWYEKWSKAGAGPNFRVENPEIYIQKFNWVGHWFEYYFFNKMSDFLLGIFFVVLVFIIFFFSKNKKKLEKNNFYYE